MKFDSIYEKLREYESQESIDSDEALDLLRMLWKKMDGHINPVTDEAALDEFASNVRLLCRKILDLYEEHTGAFSEAAGNSQTAERVQQIQTLEEQLASQVNAQSRLNEQILKLQNQIEEENRRAEKMEETKAGKDAELKEIRKKQETIKEAAEKCRNEISDGNSRLPVMEQEYEKLKSESGQIREKQEKLEKQIAEIRTQINGYDSPIALKKRELEKEKQRLEQEKAVLKQVFEEYDAVHAEFTAAKEAYGLLKSQIKQVRENTESYKLLRSLEKKE